MALGNAIALISLFLVHNGSLPYFKLGLIPIAVGLFIRSLSAGFIHKSQELATSGPYSFVRHPLYFGNSLMLLGFAISLTQTDRLWATLVLWSLILVYLTTVYKWRVDFEENSLEKKFGAAWTNYKNSVPQFLPRWPKERNAAFGNFSWRQWFINKEYQAWALTVGLVLLYKYLGT